MRDDQRKPEEMVVYTRTGDKGRTSLFDQTSVFKDDPRVEAYGTIDELVSFIGLAKHYVNPSDEKTRRLLHDIQRKLFDVCAELATIETTLLKTTITEEDVYFLEDQIDEYLKFFETPEYFVIPGDNIASAHFHICRTVARRGERQIVKVMHHDDLNENVLKYVNRLSDLMYTLSRYVEDNYEKVIF
jgi:cob(I)alamin adenosyltransferase